MKAITKEMSNVWSKTSANKYNGTADLVSADNTLLISILNEAHDSPNCAGLIWSFKMAQSALYITGTAYDVGHDIYNTPVSFYFPGTMWFRSITGSPGGGAYLINSVQIPSCGGLGTMYFWGKNGATWIPRSY